MIAAWVDLNQDLIDQAGGLYQSQGPAAFDALNERMGRRGSRRVRTLAAAVKLACSREGHTWVLDLATLTEPGPALSVGGFRPIPADDGDWAREAEVSAVGEIRDELAGMRAELFYLRSCQIWQSFMAQLDRAMPVRKVA